MAITMHVGEIIDSFGPTPGRRAGLLLLALCVAASGCSNKDKSGGSSAGTGSTGATEAPPPLATMIGFDKASPSFAAFQAESVRLAAMQYPVSQEAPVEAPISLTADDGTGLVLEALDARAVVEGPLAFTELHMRFRNPLSRVLEGRFQVTLPTGASVSRLSMKVNANWQEAEMVERQAARRAYEDFLHRKQDPMLLEKEAGNQFRARIFPIPANGVKEVILSYSHELSAKRGYRLPLRGLPEIGELKVKAMVAQAEGASATYVTQEMAIKGSVPTEDFEIKAPSTLQALRQGNHVVARVQPKLGVKATKLSGLTILFDTSASRAPGFSQQVQRLGTLVTAIATTQGAALPLRVAAFDQETTTIFEGTAGEFGKNDLAVILARRPLGASDLGAALKWAGARESLDRILVVSDAVTTAGEAEIAGIAKALPAEITRIDALLVGGIRDQEAAGRMVRGTRSQDGVVLRDDLSDTEIARRIGDATASLEVGIAGAAWTWPKTVHGIQPGDEVVVYGAFTGDKAPGATIAVEVAGSENIELPSALVPGQLLTRSVVQAQIAREQGLFIEETDPVKKATIKKTIIAMSTKYRVLSDHTALLVLESDSDYRRFGIDRNALVDILTVQEAGVRVEQRQRRFQKAPPVPQIAQVNPPTAVVALGGEGSKKERFSDTSGSSPAAEGDAESDDSDEESGSGAEMALDEGNIQREESPGATGQLAMNRGASPASDSAVDVGKADMVGGLTRGNKGSRSAHGFGSGSEVASAPPARPRAKSVARARREPVAEPRRFERKPTIADSRRRPSPTQTPPPPPPPPVSSEDPGAWGTTGDVIAPEELPATVDPNVAALAAEKSGPPALTGAMATIHDAIKAGKHDDAVAQALAWRTEESGNVMALVALGESLEAAGKLQLAARAYGSIIDLFPSRADLRRFASTRLIGLQGAGAALSVDSLQKAAEQRPDHLSVHRLLAYALVRNGDLEAAFAALETGLSQNYPGGRFDGGTRILREDLGIVAKAWLAKDPKKKEEIRKRLSAAGAALASKPSLRFVLNWETDANDVDFHIYDGQGGHAYYSQRQLPSGGELFADVTTGYGPECFAIEGATLAFPYALQIHYYSRGPMGYGMGQVEILQHDGKGGLKFDARPFVVMNDGAYLALGPIHEAL